MFYPYDNSGNIISIYNGSNGVNGSMGGMGSQRRAAHHVHAREFTKLGVFRGRMQILGKGMGDCGVKEVVGWGNHHSSPGAGS